VEGIFKGGIMAFEHIAYMTFGILLVVLMIFAIYYYYSGDRKDKVEKAKYKMLEDDDEI
jgi:cbb3-type cytochrome oxidase subunit 3